MKIKEVRDLSPDEIEVRRKEQRQNLFQLRLQQTVGQLEKPSQIRAIRREIARIETVLNERRNQSAVS